MHPTGHPAAHLPQPTHFFALIDAKLFCTVIASCSHTLVHFIQPMQPEVHALRVMAPLSWLEQRTTAGADTGRIAISDLGHALAHKPHAAHLSVSTRASPFSTWIASYSHAATQSP